MLWSGERGNSGMGKLFGLVMIVVGLWAGMTIYTDGIEGLTGRVDEGLSSSRSEQADSRRRPITQRFGDAVDAQMRKREQQLASRLDNL